MVLPLIERIFLNGAQDFTMIGTYSTNFGDASAFGAMLRAEGLEVEFKRCFFGCSSLTSQDPAEGVSAYRHLLAIGAVHPQLRVQPLPGLECEAGPDARLPRVEIPKLFGLYLRYGAWVLGPPAIDREFGTIDFLTYVDIGELDERTLATLG